MLGDGDIEVNDGTTLTKGTYIYIGQEEMYIEKIIGNTVRVRRGQDNTIAQSHVGGSPVLTITGADDNLIEFGDDFGFNGNVF